ncbi:MAG: hypothetical protein C0597_14520 [Marinilabiliales bacterium]|nr:MAG: hypothetical protein C0597_14520 [Marinilabiliales bacterium]
MTGLILSLTGATISLVLLIIEKKESKKRKIILTLSTIGLLIFFGERFISYLSSKASEEIIKNLDNRTERIDYTTTRIDSNITLIQHFVANLNNTNIEKIGVEIKDLDDIERYHAFEKGSAEIWRTYYDWLINNPDEKKSITF